jgi:hypothetical protein
MALEYSQRLNGDQSFIFTITHMEMRRRMIIIIHRNNDTQEATNFRHALSPVTVLYQPKGGKSEIFMVWLCNESKKSTFIRVRPAKPHPRPICQGTYSPRITT